MLHAATATAAAAEAAPVATVLRAHSGQQKCKNTQEKNANCLV